MTIKLKPLSLLVPPQDSGIFELFPMVAVSDAVEYDDTSVSLFTVPDKVLICGIGVIVDTAFDGVGVSLKLGDGTTTDKYMSVSEATLQEASSAFQMILKEETSSITITATLDGGSGGTAGSLRVFVMYKPKASAQRLLVQ